MWPPKSNTAALTRWRNIHCNTDGEPSTTIQMENHPLQYRWRTIHCNTDGEPSTAIQMENHPLQYRWGTIHYNLDGESYTPIQMDNISNVALAPTQVHILVTLDPGNWLLVRRSESTPSHQLRLLIRRSEGIYMGQARQLCLCLSL